VLQSFRVTADWIASIWDSDDGALLLEALGDRCATPEGKVIFY